jgi:hypothetical protein
MVVGEGVDQPTVTTILPRLRQIEVLDEQDVGAAIVMETHRLRG